MPGREEVPSEAEPTEAGDDEDAPSPTVIDRPPRSRGTTGSLPGGPVPAATGTGTEVTRARSPADSLASRVSATTGGGSANATVASPLEALAHAEVLRTR